MFFLDKADVRNFALRCELCGVGRVDGRRELFSATQKFFSSRDLLFQMMRESKTFVAARKFTPIRTFVFVNSHVESHGVARHRCAASVVKKSSKLQAKKILKSLSHSEQSAVFFFFLIS